jgi:hypothetical protein
MLTDQQIIDNTHFFTQADRLFCKTNLPGGESFQQAVSSEEAVLKNMIGWCNTVREFAAAKEAAKNEASMEARKARKSVEAVVEAPYPKPSPAPSTDNPKDLILEWYNTTQLEIDDLGKVIADATARRNELRDERDKVEPVIRAWRGTNEVV